MTATAVTPAGVRDGDPDALAGLVDRRGPAVLAYCEVVAGRGTAVAATAEAFAGFRAGVVATEDLAGLNPEALLISATRHAAARHAEAPVLCARVPPLLAARADRSISLADHDWLVEHLAGCWTCRAPVARFDAADRAYREPPRTPLAPEVTATVIAAMNAAAPVRGAAPPALPEAIAPIPHAQPEAIAPVPLAQPDAAHPNGSTADSGYGPDAQLVTHGDRHSPDDPARLDAPATHVDPPMSAYQAGDLQLDEPPPRVRPARRDASGLLASLLGAFGVRPAPGRAPARGLPAPGSAAAAGADEPRTASGTPLPRPSRVASPITAARRDRVSLRPGVVLPVALVILAIVVALIIAGVFGGEAESMPQSFTPSTTAPVDTTPAPVVVVPGAAAATAAAVERAKARARAAKRRAAQAKSETPAATTPVAPAPATAATALPTPPVTDAETAAAPSKQARDETTDPPDDAPPKIDAGNGATGAEQIPPSQDTSTVPDLAPPAEPAVPPGQ